MEGLRHTNPKLTFSQRETPAEEGDSVLSLRQGSHRLNSARGSQRGFPVNEFQCLEAKKTFIERNDFLNLFDVFEVVSFEKKDLLVLQTLATFSEEKFDPTNYGHLGLLRELYRSAFGFTDSEKNPNFMDDGGASPSGPNDALDTLVPELLENPRWEKFGFQTSTPATDFRDAGVLALRAMVHFLRHERVTYRIIREFNSKYGNYLFACAIISAVQFLKTYFHFGVVNSFSDHLTPKVCSRKVAKGFLRAMRKLPADSDKLEFFLSLVDIWVKQMFRFWCEENARTPLHVIDYSRIEAEFRKQWRKRAAQVFKRCENVMSPENVLQEFARDRRDD